jgi:para-nitrobenzyl esterase
MRRRCGRYVFLIAVVSSALSCAGAPAPVPAPMRDPGPWTGSPRVATRFGVVEGLEDADSTWVWKAVPFARPPVGALRWRAPQDPVPWSGVRREISFSSECTQFSEIVPGQINGSEDCLYLNLWRPRDAEPNLPVYVWIHGGGNSVGSATHISTYYGNRIAARSRVVFVSMNYRLGPFGWFTHPALRDGASAEDASGNFGTLDIIHALKWIRGNIAAFGGDPGLVTVTGESAGGFDVLSLLISPAAGGLFQRAMSESGAALTRGVDEADASAQEVLEKLLVSEGRARARGDARRAAAEMSADEVRSYLSGKSDRQILSQYRVIGLGMIENPAIIRDGVVIPIRGYDSLSTGDYSNKVPVILGSNADEPTIFLRFITRLPWQSDLFRAASRYGSARWKVSGVDEVARRLVANPDQPPVYAYHFTWGTVDETGRSPLPGNWGRELGSFHSLEIPFFLGNDTVAGVFQLFLFNRQNEPGRKALSAAMMKYLARFARTGNPNMPGEALGGGVPAEAASGELPSWEAWSALPGGPRSIVFDARGDAPAIAMTDEELTDEGVMASVSADLAEPLRTRTLQLLERSTLPSGVR